MSRVRAVVTRSFLRTPPRAGETVTPLDPASGGPVAPALLSSRAMKRNTMIVACLLIGSLTACQPEDRREGPAAGEGASSHDATETAVQGPPSADRSAPTAMDSAIEARVRAMVDERLAEIDTAVQRLPGLIASIRRDMRRHLNDDHLAAARRNGVGPVRDSANVAELVRSGRLVPLQDSTRWWVLRDLDRSLPYVTPGTLAALEEIGRRFHARLDEHGLPPFRLDITSVLRTSRQQAVLRRRNANAAESVSSHQFGTTVDVAYLSFAAPDSLDHATLAPPPGEALTAPLRRELMTRLDTLAIRHAPHIEGELGAVLQELQRDGTVLTLRERSQPVFHITVAQDLR